MLPQPKKSPRMTAVTDQVMAEIRDNRKELMQLAQDGYQIASHKVHTLARACILIALQELDRVDF